MLRSRNFGNVGAVKFWKLGFGLGVGHFTSDSATLVTAFTQFQIQHVRTSEDNNMMGVAC